MKIITERASLNRLIKQIEPFVHRKGDAEVGSLEYVLFEIDNDKTLVCTAQSEDRSVQIVTDADEITVEGEGKVLIPIHALKTALGAITNDDDQEVTIETRGKKRVGILADGASVEIGIMPIYPDTILPSVAKITSNTPTIEMNVADFANLYRIGGQARRLTTDFPNLCAVHLELKDGVLTALSTDKRTTVYTSAPARAVTGDEFAVLIQPNAVNEVLSLFEGDDTLSLSIATKNGDGAPERKFAHFVNGEGTIHAVTIGPSYDISGYPKVQLLGMLKGMVAGTTHQLSVNKHELLSLFKSADKISGLNNKGKEILLKLGKSEVEVSLSGDSDNTFNDSMKVSEWTGPEGVTIEVRWDAYATAVSSFPESKDGDINVAVIERNGNVVAIGAYTEDSGFNPLESAPDLPADYLCIVPVKEAV